MKCKAFDVILDLEIQAVTCPGVWLCPNGKVTVQLYLLGMCSQTSIIKPVFPLLYHEKFTFRKNFKIQNLNELEHKLSKEVVYFELIQWEDCECGNVLATFKTSLIELLYPFPKRKGVLAGIDVDLLMEATKNFPGIIAPKVEVSTKIIIKEVLCSIKNDKQCEVIVVNPKLISSKCIPKRRAPFRQKKVCHTYEYHKEKAKNKEEYNYEQVYAPSPKRSPKGLSPRKINCGCNKYGESPYRNYVQEKVKKLRGCNHSVMPCGCKGKKLFCPLCAKYKCIFPTIPCKCCPRQDLDDLLSRGTKLEEIRDFIDSMNLDNKEKIKDRFTCCKSEKHEKSPRPCSPADCERNEEKLKNRCTCCKNGKREKSPGPCSPTDYETNEVCEKLQKAHSTPTYVSLSQFDTEEETTRDRFYKNLEQFYKQLYMRAHYNLKNKKCRCNGYN